MRLHRERLLGFFLLLLVCSFAFSYCVSEEDIPNPSPDTKPAGDDGNGNPDTTPIDGKGNDNKTSHKDTLRIASFNIENFRYPSESRQISAYNTRRDKVADLIEDNEFDILGLQEINSGRGGLDNLIDGLMGRDDKWSSETGTTGGGQRVAILYNNDLFELSDVKELDASNTEGIIERANWQRLRLPLHARVTIKSNSRSFIVVVLHLKARGDDSSCMRRQEQVLDLDSWLESLAPNTDFIVLGDYNDRVRPGPGTCDSIDTLDALESDDKYVFLTDVQAGHFHPGNFTYIGAGRFPSSTLDQILINQGLLPSVQPLEGEGNFKADVIAHGDRDGISDHQPVYFLLKNE